MIQFEIHMTSDWRSEKFWLIINEFERATNLTQKVAKLTIASIKNRKRTTKNYSERMQTVDTSIRT